MTQAVVRHLIESTIFAGAIAILVFALRKRSAGIRHALWLIVTAKFALPVAFCFWLGGVLGGFLPSTRVPRNVLVVLWKFAPSQATSLAMARPSYSLPNLFLSIWLLGSALMLVFWLAKLHAPLVSADSLSGEKKIALTRLKERIAFRGGISVQFSESVEEPSLWGFWRPRIVVPIGLPKCLAAAEFEAILLHELAHAKRRDNWTGAFAHLIACVFWFYPLLWWVERRMRLEGERACDELVVRSGALPEDYVAGIFKVCRLHFCEGIAGVSGVCGSNLKDRMEAIMSLPPEKPRSCFFRPLLAGLVGVITIAPLSVGLLRASALGSTTALISSPGDSARVTATAFTMARQPDAPLIFQDATFELNDLLHSATLVNVGTQTITRYRIGWTVGYNDGRHRTVLGNPTTIRPGLAPHKMEYLPAQGISPHLLEGGAREIIFFVNDVGFQSGESWHANISTIESYLMGSEVAFVASHLPFSCVSGGVEYPEGTVIQIGNGPEQMCARVLDEAESKQNPNVAPRYYPEWIHTDTITRERSSEVLHVPEPPPVSCNPKPAGESNLCSCENSGVFSPGALVNSAKGPLQLRCDNGKDRNKDTQFRARVATHPLPNP